MTQASEVAFEVEGAREFVRIRVRGGFTRTDAEQAQPRAAALPHGARRLWDFRAADLTDWSALDMRLFIQFVTARMPADGRARVAVLAGRDVEFGLARMFEFFFEDRAPFDHAVFRDDAKAIAWMTGAAPGPPAD